MRTNLLLKALTVAALIGAGCAESDTFSDGLLPVDTTPPTEPVTMVVETANPMDMVFNEVGDLVVKVTYAESGLAAAERPVFFSLRGAPADVELSIQAVVTDINGRAAVRVSSGATRTSFDVLAKTVQNDGTDLELPVMVVVDGVYRGDLVVGYAEQGSIETRDIETRVHEGALDCSRITAALLPETIDEASAANAAATTRFARLVEANYYTVTAVAMGPAGNPVAFGCEISPEIQGREAVTMTVDLIQYPLDIDGDYTFATDLHLNEALPPPADEIVARVEQFFVDPAGLVLYYIGEYLAANTSITAEQFENATRAAGVLLGYDSIEEALYANVIDRLPSEVIATMNVGGDVVGLMNNLRVGGDMLLSNNEGIVSGRYGWQDFLFTWRLGSECDFTNTCCGRTTFSGEEVGLEPVGAALAGVFEEIEVERGAAPRGTIAIDEHRLDLQYGNLILFTLNQFVLPALTGQDNLACGIESIMGCEPGGSFVCGGPNVGTCGCDRIANWLATNIPSLPLDPAVVASGCSLGMQAAQNLVQEQLNRLVFNGVDNGYLSMRMELEVVDNDFNLAGDHVEGTPIGQLQLGDTIGTEFSADLRARLDAIGCRSDKDCDGGFICGVEAQTLNTCEADFSCKAPIGARIAGERCVDNAQCASGACLDNQCFGACTVDTDCPTGKVCVADAVEWELSDGVKTSVATCR